MSGALYLYNPLSNEGKAEKDWKLFVEQHPEVTKNAFAVNTISNLTEFLKDHPAKIIVIAGGDGTVNSVCRGVLELQKKPTLAVLPLGFGNALSYSFGVETLEKALAVINNPRHHVAIDVMKTNLPKSPIGMFNIGVGFDARIVHTRHMRRYIGFRSYLLSAVRSIMFDPQSEIKFTIDHAVTLSALASSLMVTNSPSIGQNYMVAPQAKMNDGLLDCTLFSTKYAYITNLRFRGFKHPLYSRVGKVHFKAAHLKIEGEPFVQVDGDPEEQQQGLEIAVLKKQLTFLYNKDVLANSEELPFIVSKR